MSVFLSESDAKVRLIFETAKCFAIFFAKKCIFVQQKGGKHAWDCVNVHFLSVKVHQGVGA